MVEVWRGSISIDGDTQVEDVRLASPIATSLVSSTKLTFLSLIDVGQMPLHIRCGPLLDVTTSSLETSAWFDIRLCSDDNEGHGRLSPWWTSGRFESDVGVLARIDAVYQTASEAAGVRLSEILFFAVKTTPVACPPTPPQSSASSVDESRSHTTDDGKIEVKAVLLSSDLLDPMPSTGLTPPPSPRLASSDSFQARFLPEHLGPSKPNAEARKRKSLNDTFEEASKRRRTTKKNIGGSVAAVASQHSQSSSAIRKPLASPADVVAVPKRSHSLSRPPSRSTSATRTDIHMASPAQSRPSTATSKPPEPKAVTSIEQKNKDLISRLIMAGMRLHGLSQSKSKTPLPSTTQSTDTAAEARVETERNETFKLTYHNTLKAAIFAFRMHIATRTLAEHTDQVRDMVDRLLGIFCTDPLAFSISEGATPGTTTGRTPFRTPMMREEGEGFPFPVLSSAEQKTRQGIGVAAALSPCEPPKRPMPLAQPSHIQSSAKEANAAVSAGLGIVEAGERLAGKGKGKEAVFMTPVKKKPQWQPGF